MKNFFKFGGAALCLTFAIVVMAACAPTTVNFAKADIDVNIWRTGATAKEAVAVADFDFANNELSYTGIANNVIDVEIDLAKWFTANKLLGKNFTFTRSDVEDAGALVTGSAWLFVEHSGGHDKFIKYGTTVSAINPILTKAAIEGLGNKEGAARLYIYENGTTIEGAYLYADPSTGSDLQTLLAGGTYEVEFVFEGNGKKATLNTIFGV